MGRLESKVALITGATSGIGRTSAQRFAEEGAKLFIVGRRQTQLKRLIKEKTPLARLADAAEIAAAALFLASAKSSYVNGSEPFVDGRSAQK